jgi:serine/threonine protein kinase
MTDLLRWARSFGAEPQVALDSVAPSRPAVGVRATTLEPMQTVELDADSRYGTEGVLGRGGVGEVELVLDHDLGRRVARKRLRSEYRGDPTLLQAFLEEAMITGALEHPGIVPVYDLGVSPGEGPWYTMKRLEGEPLSTVLSRLRQGHNETLVRWPLPRLVEVFVQVLRAVAHAHERRVIHCDLKPGNVLVGELGEVVVVDWGLAKVMGEGGKDQARARLWSGSPGYMPPEQALSDDYEALTAASDIWALGAILYELMVLVVPQAGPDGGVPEPTGEVLYPPVHGLKARAQIGPYRRETPAALVAVAERALRHEPLERYLSAREMLSEVDSWLQGSREQERRESRVIAAARVADAALVGHTADVGKLAEVTDLLIEALAVAPGRPELVWRSSALYWHIFRLLHLTSPGETRADYTRMLDRLAAMVVPAPESTSGIAPWLEALDEVADEAPQVRALAERLRALHAAPLFASLDGHELLPVASAVEVRGFSAGEALVREGERGDALWVLVSGTVEVTAQGKTLNVLGPPACFGEIALVDRSTRTASVVAQTDVMALTLTAERFDGLVKQHGAIALGVMRLMAERLRRATEREVGKR